MTITKEAKSASRQRSWNRRRFDTIELVLIVGTTVLATTSWHSGLSLRGETASSAASSWPGSQMSQGTRLQFRLNGEPAEPEPSPADRAWSAATYMPLHPSREDGLPTFSNDWFKWKDDWLKALGDLAGKPNLRYLEVGVYEGQSLVWLFQNVFTHPSSSGVAIDLFDFDGLEERFRENVDRAGIGDRITTLLGYSNEALRSLEGQQFDVIYIDASHTAPNVTRDAVLSWDLLKPGGYLIFDDYQFMPSFPSELRPQLSIDGFISAFRDELRVVHRGWQLILERIPDPCPGISSSLGPYCYYWSLSDDSPDRGLLVDRRTEARVLLSEDERTLIETLLRARPFGHEEILVTPDLADSKGLDELRARLDI